jgi:PLP dependent protein
MTPSDRDNNAAHRAASIASCVAAVRREIAQACARVGRDPAGVALIAVTKSQGPEVLPALRAAGVRDFGENRVEHLAVMRAAALPGDRWHYIGRVQSRQLAAIAPDVEALHSLCDPSHVERLQRICRDLGRRLPVYVQVNASGEASKAGLPPEAVAAVLHRVRGDGSLSLAGLMTMAPELDAPADAPAVRACFARLRELARAHGTDGLSMGMSGDFAIAVEEGATAVRVGSRLFADTPDGPRRADG